MGCTWLGFILVVMWHFHPELPSRILNDGQMPKIFKFYWSLHNVTLILSLMITLLYWGIVYDKDRDALDAVNLLTHGSNSIFMMIDLLIVSHPIRLMHVIQPVLFGLAYGFFTYIYYLCGGVDA